VFVPGYQPKIYVAGPYTHPDPIINTRKAIEAGEALWQAGCVPFIPHAMTILWHGFFPKDHQGWLDYDFHWVDACDGLLRLPGASAGADMEVARAIAKRKQLFTSMDGLIDAYAGVLLKRKAAQ